MTTTTQPPIAHCRSCGAAIWWGTTPKGKSCPFNYDLVTGQPTQESHFRTCPDATSFSKKGPARGNR